MLLKLMVQSIKEEEEEGKELRAEGTADNVILGRAHTHRENVSQGCKWTAHVDIMSEESTGLPGFLALNLEECVCQNKTNYDPSRSV